MEKKYYAAAAPEMVEKLIEEYYTSDVNHVERLLKNFARANKPELDVDKIITDVIAARENMAVNVSEYEDELVRMLDLSAILLEQRSTNDDMEQDEYINYLLEKNVKVLPDVIEIIQLLKK